jgi:hypothetical protein
MRTPLPGFVKIQANGLRAARAIDPRLEEAIKRAGGL